MRHSYVFAAAVALVVLTGCATLIQKPFQDVRVVTPGVENADCVIETGKMRYRVLTPDTTLVERSPFDMTITCEKTYYFTAVKIVPSRLKAGWTALNVTNGVVPGVATDVATRSIYAYPKIIKVEMVPDLEAMAEARASLAEPVTETRKKERPVREEPLTNDGDQAVDRALRK